MESGEMMRVVTAVYNARFRGRGEMYGLREDLIGAGVVGAMKAVRRFDEARGLKLSTFVWESARRSMEAFARGEVEYRRAVSEEDVGEYADFLRAEDDVREDFTFKADIEKVRRCCDGMGEKSREVANELLNGRKQRDVAREMGCSSQYVSGVFGQIRGLARAKYEYSCGELIEKGESEQ